MENTQHKRAAIFSAFFYICLGLLVGHILVNANITGFAIWGANSSPSGKLISVLFLVFSFLFVMTRGAPSRLEGQLRGITVKLPNLGCHLVGVKHNKENDSYTIMYSQDPGFHGQAIRDTGVLIPTEDPTKIRYERVAEPKGKTSRRGTIQLPYLEDQYIGTVYDPERDVFVIKYESQRGGIVRPAIRDTRIPLPVEDENKIVYQDVQTGREYGGKKAKR